MVKTSRVRREETQCKDDLMQSIDQWVCAQVLRLSEAERESENKGNKDGKVVWLA